MSMSKELAKCVSQFMSGAGTSMIVANVVQATLPAGMGLMAKVFVSAGQIAISMMGAEKVSEYVGQKVDSVFDDVQVTIEDAPIEETVV